MLLKKKKPLILSTGMANLDEIGRAIKTVKKTGNNKIIVLHCVSKYPSKHSDYNLLTMQEIAKKFDVHIGLSDHTEGSITPLIASGLGAKVIEKHVKLQNDNKSHDSKFSFSVKDLKQLSEQIENAWECRGIVDFKKTQERSQIKFRRSIYVVEDIKKNQVLTKKILRG